MDRGLLRAGLERMFEGGLEIFPRFLEEVPNPPRYLLGIPVVLARSRLENHLDPKTVSGLYRPERVGGFLQELAVWLLGLLFLLHPGVGLPERRRPWARDRCHCNGR